MTNLAERSESMILASLDSILDLEFYMPVDEHRQRWTGGAELLAASVPNDDGSLRRGFDLAGEEVPLSIDRPPETPALVLTPVEGDYFAARPASEREHAPALTHYASSGWFMRFVHIADDHEFWGIGDPEFEVHVFVEQPNAIYEDIICAGADMPSPYYWDMNEDDWSGDVLLGTEAAIGDKHLQFQMWENDNDACTTTAGRPPATDGVTIGELGNWASQIVNIHLASGEIRTLQATWNALGTTYDLVQSATQDDFVGIMEGPDHGCWPPAGLANFRLRASEDGPEQGLARVDVTYGVREPECVLQASIDGPSNVQLCFGSPSPPAWYNAVVVGGSGPTTCAWYDDWVLVGSGSSYQLENASVGSRYLQLFVDRAVSRRTTR